MPDSIGQGAGLTTDSVGLVEAFAALQVRVGHGGGNGAAFKEPLFHARHTGARVSKLWQMLSEGHHEVVLRRKNCAITPGSTAFNFYAAYSAVERQGRGEIVICSAAFRRVDFASLVR